MEEELLHAFIYGLRPDVKTTVLIAKPMNVTEAQTSALAADEAKKSVYNSCNNNVKGKSIAHFVDSRRVS